MVMFVSLSDKEYFARFGSIEFFQLLDRVAPGTQHHNSFFVFGIQFRMDFATDFLCRLGTLNQNMAIPIMCVIANLLDKSGDHVVKTDNDDVVLQRVNDIAFTISLNSAFQHIGDYGYQ